MYKLTQTDTIIRIADSACIPADVRNADYQQFLRWIEHGNTPDAADITPVQSPQEISKAQGIAVMSNVPVGESNLWLAVKAYFDTEADEISRDLFKAITVFNRQSPILNSLKGRFGLTDEDLDQLFIEGAKVFV